MDLIGNPANDRGSARLTIISVGVGAMALFILLAIGSAATSLLLSSAATAVLEAQPQTIAGISDVKDLERSVVNLDAAMNRYLASVNPEDKKKFLDGATAAQALLKRIADSDSSGGSLVAVFDSWIEAATKSIRLMSMLSEAEERRRAVDTEIRNYSVGKLGRLESRRMELANHFSTASHLQIVVLVITLALSLGLAWIMHRMLVKPLQYLIEVTHQIAAGDRAADLARKLSIRDLERLQDALCIFQRNAAEREGLLQDRLRSASRHDRAERVNRLIAEFEQEMRQTLVRLDTSASELTKGSNTLGNVSQAAAADAKGVDRICEELNNSVSILMASAEQIKAGIAEMSHGAFKSQGASERAVIEARDMKVTMQELGQLANDIGDILEIIKALAGQTNLLALNATIEAARAGELGRGFAVVAAEVKTLANQSARAANEIATKITAIQHASQRTMQAIAKVDAIVCENSSHATAVATIVRQQNLAIDDMTVSLTKTSEASQLSAGSAIRVRDSAHSTEEVAKLVEEHAHGISIESERLESRIHAFLDSVKAA